MVRADAWRIDLLSGRCGRHLRADRLLYVLAIGITAYLGNSGAGNMRNRSRRMKTGAQQSLTTGRTST
jgi:hypothetical protein